MKTALTFDDVNIIPTISDVSSRLECNLTTRFTKNYNILSPIIASPMASICEEDMMFAMWELGGVGILHRFNSIKDQCDIVKNVINKIKHEQSTTFWPDSIGGVPINYVNPVIAAAVGVRSEDEDRAIALLQSGVNVILIDVAHGHHSSVKLMLWFLNELKDTYEFDIIVGNVATLEGTEDLEDWGADAVRVGIGGGSACETRIRTGVGIPQLTSLQWAVEGTVDVPIISCGGAKYPGDVAKALCAGAESVILGSMLSGTQETPGDVMRVGMYGHRKNIKMYYGSASDVQKTISQHELKNIEGTAAMVPYKGPVKNVIMEIEDGIRSCMSYVGARTIEELYTNSEFVQVTSNGLREAMPHLL